MVQVNGIDIDIDIGSKCTVQVHGASAWYKGIVPVHGASVWYKSMVQVHGASAWCN